MPLRTALFVLACTVPEPPEELPAEEVELRELFAATGIDLRGRILGPGGDPLEARVAVGEVEVETAADGTFRLLDLPRHNVLVEVSARGHRTEHVPAWLFRPLDREEVILDPIRLQPRAPGVVRFLFGGDVMFGRRYLDPEAPDHVYDVPPDTPEAPILASDPLPGSRSVLASIRPWFQAVDYGAVNLETVVTDQPATPHTEKDYVFFSLPESLEALTWLGADYVSLGNNHIYDYLEHGVVETLHHVSASDLATSGAGHDADEAWLPWRFEQGGHPWSLLSANSVSGDQFSIGYQAGEDRGGAADLRDNDAVVAAVAAERDAGRVPIALWHTGKEYSFQASDYARSRYDLAVEGGAALVVGHHPHVAQGFRVLGEDVLVADCLGNLVMDQDRLETMLGLLLQVDLDGDRRVHAEALPVYVKRYHPRPVTGEIADVLLRRVAEFSEGLAVVPYHDRALLLPEAAAEDRSLTLTVDVPASGWTVLDLREHQRPGESVARVAGEVSLRVGRDLLVHGTFEDLDVDDDARSVPLWDVSSPSRFSCLIGARRGAVGLCSTRDSRNATASVAAFRNRIRVWGDGIDAPNKDLTAFGYTRGENAGPVEIVARYYASEGEAEFGEALVFSEEGTWPWRPFAADLDLPADVDVEDRAANARAVRYFLHHHPPARGEALAMFDDLALISWEETWTGAPDLATPHGRDFLRVEAAPGSHALEVTLRRHRPL